MCTEDFLYSRLQDLGFILLYLLGVGVCLKFIWRGLILYFNDTESVVKRRSMK